jgi:hypothetical protein
MTLGGTIPLSGTGPFSSRGQAPLARVSATQRGGQVRLSDTWTRCEAFVPAVSKVATDERMVALSYVRPDADAPAGLEKGTGPIFGGWRRGGQSVEANEEMLATGSEQLIYRIR